MTQRAERAPTSVDVNELGTVGLFRKRADLKKHFNAEHERKRLWNESRRAFEEKYGIALALQSLAFFDPELHKRGHIVYSRSTLTDTQVADKFSVSLYDAVSSQPEEERRQWLRIFFSDLNSVLQFRELP